MAEFVFHRASQDDLPAIVSLLADDELGKSREILSNPVDQAYVGAYEVIDRDLNQLLIAITRSEGRVIGTMQLTFLTHLARRGAIRAQIEAIRVASDGTGRWGWRENVTLGNRRSTDAWVQFGSAYDGSTKTRRPYILQ